MKLDQDLVVTCFSSAHAGAVAELLRKQEEAWGNTPADESGLLLTKDQLIHGTAERMAYVAVNRAQVVGAILIEANDGKEPVIKALCVEPALRGDGIGSLLLETAEKRTAELGCRALRVSKELKEQGFFGRLGYSLDEDKLELVKPLM